jgi:catalase
VAILVAAGSDGTGARKIHASLLAQGAVPRIVGAQLGTLAATGKSLEVEISMETGLSVLWDGLIAQGGNRGVEQLAASGQALEFLKDQYGHCKPILLLGASVALLATAGIPATLPPGA